ncbi:MAG: HAD family hydrolase [Polyangiales bacterium]
MTVALFDMDRTLVRKNTAQLYVRYQRRNGEASMLDSLRVAWWVAQYTIGIVDAEGVAVKVLRGLEGIHENVMAARCDDWFRRDVVHHVGEEARRTVARHLGSGDVCAIVTGAWRYSADPLARALEIPHVIATELERDAEGRFTGRHIQPLCYGHGKIARSEALAKEHGYSLRDATFYSDSISDLPLLEAVGTPVAVNPDPRLLRVARARGWRIERW